MRILVCGGRDYDDFDKMMEVMGEHFSSEDVLIHGGAAGADSLSELIFTHYMFSEFRTTPAVERYFAEWDKYGKAAGHIRNTRMLKEGKPDLVIAFPGGRGTANMVKQAQDAGIQVIIVKN